MSPDPLGGQLEDPQSLNRHVYARDNPVTLTDSTGLSFELDCAQDNGTTCQGGHVYYQDENGKYRETIINSGKNDALTDQQGNRYNGTFDGKQVTFTAANGSKSTGAWIQGSQETKGITGGGALSNKFNFTFSDHGAGQRLHADWKFNGTASQAEAALAAAGLSHLFTDSLDVLEPPTLFHRSVDFRSPGSDSTHFIVYQPWFGPKSTVPTVGSMHAGEHNPHDSTGSLFDHLKEVF